MPYLILVPIFGTLFLLFVGFESSSYKILSESLALILLIWFTYALGWLSR